MYRTPAEHEPEHECAFHERRIRVDYEIFDFCSCGAMRHSEMPWWHRVALLTSRVIRDLWDGWD